MTLLINPLNCLLTRSDPEVYEQALNQCKNVQACAAILMEKGAKVNLADQQGMQPLHYAMQFPSESINPLYTECCLESVRLLLPIEKYMVL